MNQILNYEVYSESGKFSENDKELIRYLIENTKVDENNRLIMPCLFNIKLETFLPNNFQLAVSVLKSIKHKFIHQLEKFTAYDEVIQGQIESGIIEPVEGINSLKYNNKISFIAHNAVFRENVASTKCRIVYLANLCDKSKASNLSHNNISLPGPSLNNKLHIAITLLRFNKYLLIYDLEKAYHQIKLTEEDTKKLHFLWFKNIKEGNFELVAYKLLRLPFGLRFSPFVLMIALYIILILQVDTYDDLENEIRKNLYNLLYMDNLAFSTNMESDIQIAFHKSRAIFDSYGFTIQQVYSNSRKFQNLINKEFPNTRVNEPEKATKLLGMIWDIEADVIYNNNNKLNPQANTLRSILSSINSCFDPLNIGLPGRNRMKLFLHELQHDKSLKWDKKINDKKLKIYKKICTQYNNSSYPKIPRYVGNYKGMYNIVSFTDASKDLYGNVIYLQDVSNNTLHFLCSKNSHFQPAYEKIHSYIRTIGVEVRGRMHHGNV